MKGEKGLANSTDCPRSGYIKLFTEDGRSLTLPTTCKQWGCLGCRERVKSLVKARIVYGCSMAVYSYLITVTYRTVGVERRNADSVAKDWTRLLRILKKRYPNLSWFRIVEATKKGQPHLHVIAQNIGQEYRRACHTGKDRFGKCMHRWDAEFRDMICEVNCIEHEWANEWFAITEDSWIVDARPVLGDKGAAKYLSKYLTKASTGRSALEELGFTRRWSCSRNWPRFEALRLRQTVGKGWKHTAFKYSDSDDVYLGEREEWEHAAAMGLHTYLSERVGNEYAWNSAKEQSNAKIMKGLKQIYAINRQATPPKPDRSSRRQGDRELPITTGRSLK